MHSGKQQRGPFVLDVLAEKERKEQRDLPKEFPNKISVIIIQFKKDQTCWEKATMCMLFLF
uniref:Uncharacterized protein n=1 Tax=Setaria viridis TaxID=4556 RepID=A0A4U6U753_SETVI|nr:hypothetical protein SEVIR_6G198800v2 [Setaria viridis]